MKKNVIFRFRIDTCLLDKLRKEAEDMGINISELMRQKIESPPQIKRIEILLLDIYKKFEKIK